MMRPSSRRFFFFNDTATTEIYTLSLHDALPISPWIRRKKRTKYSQSGGSFQEIQRAISARRSGKRSEEHTSELQSRPHLVCRLLLEKKKWRTTTTSGRLASKRRCVRLPTRRRER